jgi:hypothetical protein
MALVSNRPSEGWFDILQRELIVMVALRHVLFWPIIFAECAPIA